ncbi:MAG: hypothetical protein ABEH40_08845 [Haloferacaceae archaeon]
MPDTKDGREKQARDEENRQREREVAEARERADEPEPPVADEAPANDGDAPPACHRRGCAEPATFVVRERYREGGGHGAVEAEARLCTAHAAEEHPTNLDPEYADYAFRIDPLR